MIGYNSLSEILKQISVTLEITVRWEKESHGNPFEDIPVELDYCYWVYWKT